MAEVTKRITGGYSIHTEEKPELCPDRRHAHWRVVRCDDKWDTVECGRCGKQREAWCTMDEDCK